MRRDERGMRRDERGMRRDDDEAAAMPGDSSETALR
jgi:hypothetical protein